MVHPRGVAVHPCWFYLACHFPFLTSYVALLHVPASRAETIALQRRLTQPPNHRRPSPCNKLIFVYTHTDRSLMHACVLSCFSCVWLCATLWTAARQAPLSTGFSRQEYQSGLPCSPPGDHSRPRDRAHVFYIFCTGRWVLSHQCLGRLLPAELDPNTHNNELSPRVTSEWQKWWSKQNYC